MLDPQDPLASPVAKLNSSELSAGTAPDVLALYQR